VSQARIDALSDDTRFWPISPDLAIEVKSKAMTFGQP
jgi:Uma2 family endonuclease